MHTLQMYTFKCTLYYTNTYFILKKHTLQMYTFQIHLNTLQMHTLQCTLYYTNAYFTNVYF